MRLTVQPWGGTPADSIYEVVLFAGATEVGRFTFNAPDDVAAFVGVWSDTAFDRATIIDATGNADDEYFGEFFTGTTPMTCPDENLCTVEDKAVFLAATGAEDVTGPLPDVGEVKKEVTVGEVTLAGKPLFVGAGGNPQVVNSDWTLLLDGPDIALTGNDPKKKLEVSFAQPVYAVGFDFVEPQTGPNVGKKFSDATFAVTLKAGKQVVGEFVFNAPNDTATFVGLAAQVPFDRMLLETDAGRGNKFVGRFYAGTSPVLTRPYDILVVDADAGTNRGGALFLVDPMTGIRTLLSDFGDGSKGPLGEEPYGVTVETSDAILVVDPGAGTNPRGALFRVDAVTGFRTLLSDFGTSPGPLGENPSNVAVEASGAILVADRNAGTGGHGALFRVNSTTGKRTLLSDFGKSSGPLGGAPNGVAVEASGDILVVDSNIAALFRVDSTTGKRTLLSVFGDSGQGPIGEIPYGVAILLR